MAKKTAIENLGITDLSNVILDQLPTTVMAVDIDMKLIYLNKAGEKILGLSFEEAKGKQCAALFCSDHCNTENCRMKQTINTGNSLTARNAIDIKGIRIPIEYFTAPSHRRYGRTAEPNPHTSIKL